jgi:hypothetical protein
MAGEVVIVRGGVACRYREVDCLLMRSTCREGGAGMAIAVNPIGALLQESFVSAGSFRVTTAIAEQPGAKIRDGIVIGSRGKGDATAFERLRAAPGVVQLFAKATGELRRVVPLDILPAQIIEARIQRAAFQCAGKVMRIDRQLGVTVIERQP